MNAAEIKEGIGGWKWLNVTCVQTKMLGGLGAQNWFPRLHSLGDPQQLWCFDSGISELSQARLIN